MQCSFGIVAAGLGNWYTWIWAGCDVLLWYAYILRRSKQIASHWNSNGQQTGLDLGSLRRIWYLGTVEGGLLGSESLSSGGVETPSPLKKTHKSKDKTAQHTHTHTYDEHCSFQNICKVLINREQNLLSLAGVISVILFHGPEASKKGLILGCVPWRSNPPLMHQYWLLMGSGLSALCLALCIARPTSIFNSATPRKT